MKRHTLLFAPDSAAGSGAPAPAPAAPANPAAIPATPPGEQPLSTETLAASIKVALNTPASASAPVTPAPATPTPTPTAGPEPSPAGAPGAAAPTETVLEEDGVQTPSEATQWPKSAIDTITAVRAKARDKRKEVESARDAEKARADALQQELAALKQQQPNPSKRPEAPAAAGDALATIPEVAQARAEHAKHAQTHQSAVQLLAQLRTDPDGVRSILKQAGVPADNAAPEDLTVWLERCRDEALAHRSEAAAMVRTIEMQAAQQLGAQRQDWTHTAQALAPDLARAGTPTHKEVQDALKRFPWLAQDPMGDYAALAFVEGHKLLQGKAKRLQTPAAAPATTATTTTLPPAPLPGAAASLPAATAPGNNVDELRARFFKTGKEEDRTAWVRATMGLSPAAA
jgi:cytochrome c556